MIKRICLFTTEFAFNRQIMLNYLEDIIPKSVKIFLFIPKGLKDKFSAKRATVVHTKFGKFLSFFELRKFCKKEKIDRIVNLGVLPQEGFVMLFSSLFSKTDFIMFFVGNSLYFYKIGLRKYGIKGFFELISSYPLAIFPQKIIITARDVHEIYKNFFFFSRKKIFHLPLTVDTSLFKIKNKIICRKKLNFQQNKKIVIYVGRVGHMKGSEIIFELAKRNTDIDFVFVGDIDKEIKIPNSSNIILFSPKSSKELVDYYNAADLCIFPSRVEGFGLVPREAMSCGTPALVSDIMSLRLIEPAFRAKLNTISMENELKRFFNLTEKQKKELSLKSRKFVINECDSGRLKNRYQNLILK